MALNPLSARDFPPSDHSVQRRRRREVDETQQPKSVQDWERQLDEELQGSLTYQVVKRVLLNETLTLKQIVQNDSEVDKSTASEDEAVAVNTEIRIELQIDVELKVAISQTQSTTKKSDPLVIDLNGDGVQLNADQRISFDIDADGKSDSISQLTVDDYFLACDKNGNQRIDDGTELFGDQLGASNGFTALARFDDNHDGQIDRSDRIFSSLRLVQIDQLRAQTQLSLQEAGIKSLGLYFQQTQQLLASGDEVAQQGAFDRDDNSRGKMLDILFRLQT